MANFLQNILPDLPALDYGQPVAGYFVLGLKDGNRVQYPCGSIADVERAGQAISAAGGDAYMALASYRDVLLGRKKGNGLHLKSLWADLDVGKTGTPSYDTVEAALFSLTSFITDTGLKPTYVVSSGRGLHVYWALAQKVESRVWGMLASAFKEFCQRSGLVIDPVCTADTARVLRLPGTVHQSTKSVVKILADSGVLHDPRDIVRVMGERCPDALASFSQAPIIQGDVTPPLPSAVCIETLPNPPLAKAEPIVRGCPQMLTSGLLSEPTWYAAMSVLRRCVDGLEWAHKLSSMDVFRYTPEGTEKKFWHAPEDAPARCSRFAEIEPSLCDKCAYKGQISSPVQIFRKVTGGGSAVSVAESSVKDAPVTVTERANEVLDHLVIPDKYDYQLRAFTHPRFSVDDRGIILKQAEKDAAGEYITVEHVICASRLYFSHSVHAEEDGAPRRTHWFTFVHPNGRREDVPLVVSRDLCLNGIQRWFNEANAFPTSGSYKPQIFLDFMIAFLQTVTGDAIELNTRKAFGWSKVIDPLTREETEGFAIGKGVITSSGMHPSAFDGAALRIAEKELTVKGNLEAWKEVPRMYRVLDQPEAQLAICLAFAAPLMRYGSGSAKSATYSLWSDKSGLGKTQVLRAAASIWGDPDEQFLQRQSSSVARMRKLAVLNNLPAYMDELTDVKDEDLYSLAYSLVGGTEKTKLKSGGADMVDTGSWSTVTFATANKSFKEAAARYAGDSEASLLRVIEYECSFKSYADQPLVQRYIEACMENCRMHHGLAGPEFMYQVMRHSDRLLTLTKQVEHWCSKHGFHANERFLGFPLALALKAGRWAVEWGLLDYDMDALERWVLNELVPHNRRTTRANAPDFVNLLGTYLLERQLNMVTVSSAMRTVDTPEVARGMPDKYIIQFPTQQALVRAVLDTRTVYFAKQDFSQWCKQRNHSVSVVTRQLEEFGIAVPEVSHNLTSGISWANTPTVKCYKLDAAALDVLGFAIPEKPVEELPAINTGF